MTFSGVKLSDLDVSDQKVTWKKLVNIHIYIYTQGGPLPVIN